MQKIRQVNLDQILEKSRQFALSQVDEYGLPTRFHLELSFNKGQELAKQLGADATIVGIGTYLMDCMLGKAFSLGKKEKHVVMSVERTRELLADFAMDKTIEEQLIACVAQHHGGVQFDSLEAEICCNADCYRFLSLEGFIGGIHHGRKMDVKSLLKLYDAKAEEKWRALTLDVCQDELEPQYEAIRQLTETYQKNI